MTALSKILGVLGVVLVLGGLALGFRSVSAGNVDCGSVFAPAAGITPMACDGKLNTSSTLVTVVVVAGVVSLVAAFVVKLVDGRRTPA